MSRALGPLPYLLPSLLLLGVFTYWPILRALYTSFFAWSVSNPKPVYAGLANYATLLKQQTFWLVLQNTTALAAVGIPCLLVLGLLLALLLNEPLGMLRPLYRAAVFYPTMLPMAAAAMLWVWLFNPGVGLVNHYLEKLGVPAPEWLYDMNWALPAILITWIWKNVGYLAVVYLAGLQAIPKDLLEAARVEGANVWQEVWRIKIPLLGPSTVFAVAIAILGSFQIFDAVHIMTQGGPADRTNVLVYYLYQQGFRFWDVGVANALTIFFVAALFCVIVPVVRFMERHTFYEV